MAAGRTEIEIAACIHGTDFKNRHIRLCLTAVVIAGAFGVTEARIIDETCFGIFAFQSAEMPAVPREMLGRVFDFENLRLMHQNTAAEFDVRKSGQSLCKGCVNDSGHRGRPTEINPISAVHKLCRFFRTREFLFVFFLIAHGFLLILFK